MCEKHVTREQSSCFLLSTRLTSPSLQHTVITGHLPPWKYLLCRKLLSHLDVEKEGAADGCIEKAQITESVPHRRAVAAWVPESCMSYLSKTGGHSGHGSKHPPTFMNIPDLMWKSKSAQPLTQLTYICPEVRRVFTQSLKNPWLIGSF